MLKASTAPTRPTPCSGASIWATASRRRPMKNTKYAAAVLIAALIAVPVFAQRGSANFTRFVTLGDSYGAGFESQSLNERHQVWSWPAIIARQLGKQIC